MKKILLILLAFSSSSAFAKKSELTCDIIETESKNIVTTFHLGALYDLSRNPLHDDFKYKDNEYEITIFRTLPGSTNSIPKQILDGAGVKVLLSPEFDNLKEESAGNLINTSATLDSHTNFIASSYSGDLSVHCRAEKK